MELGTTVLEVYSMFTFYTLWMYVQIYHIAIRDDEFNRAFFIFLQGKPTEASKDINVLQYGEKDTRNYLPGNASTCFLYNTMKSCICIGD